MDNIAKHFWCTKDKHYYLTEEYTIGEDIAVSKCEICRGDVEEVPHFYANLDKMHKSSTGPKTPQGKKRSSMNGYKHGMRSRQLHLLAPAITDRYPECNGCQYKEPCKNDDDFKYCPVIVQPMMTFIKAYEEGNSADLKSFAGFTHARVYQILQMVLKDIFTKGVSNPHVIKTTINEHGNDITKVIDWIANPLLKRIPELMGTIGQLAEQQLMTPSKQQDQENVEGFLKHEAGQSTKLDDYIKDQSGKMNDLKAKVVSAIEKRKKDETLQQFEEEENKES